MHLTFSWHDRRCQLTLPQLSKHQSHNMLIQNNRRSKLALQTFYIVKSSSLILTNESSRLFLKSVNNNCCVLGVKCLWDDWPLQKIKVTFMLLWQVHHRDAIERKEAFENITNDRSSNLNIPRHPLQITVSLFDFWAFESLLWTFSVALKKHRALGFSMRHSELHNHTIISPSAAWNIRIISAASTLLKTKFSKADQAQKLDDSSKHSESWHSETVMVKIKRD